MSRSLIGAVLSLTALQALLALATVGGDTLRTVVGFEPRTRTLFFYQEVVDASGTTCKGFIYRARRGLLYQSMGGHNADDTASADLELCFGGPLKRWFRLRPLKPLSARALRARRLVVRVKSTGSPTSAGGGAYRVTVRRGRQTLATTTVSAVRGRPKVEVYQPHGHRRPLAIRVEFVGDPSEGGYSIDKLLLFPAVKRKAHVSSLAAYIVSRSATRARRLAARERRNGLRALRRNRYDVAQRLFGYAALLAPRRAALQILRARALTKLARYPEAIAALKAALNADGARTRRALLRQRDFTDLRKLPAFKQLIIASQRVISR